MRRVALVAVAAAALVGCGGSAASARTFNDPHGTITVATGQKFTIALEVTPGTGYSWQLTREPNSSIVKYLGSKTTSGSGPGSPAQQLLRFQARKAGRTTMTLAYVGPGRNPAVGQRRTLAVRVR